MIAQAEVICSVCSKVVLPHQCAHGGGFAVCFGCGGSSYPPTWDAETREAGQPAYAQLAALRALPPTENAQ